MHLWITWDIFPISRRSAMQKRPKLQPFLVRLHPDTRAMLDRATEEQRRSRAAIIDEAIREMLGDRYTGVEDRLNALLGQSGGR